MSRRRNVKRRHVLAAAAVAATAAATGIDPMRGLIQSMIRSLILTARRRTMAKTFDEPARNYLKIHPYGSPLRYLFDHPLRPWDHSGFKPNPHIFNRLTEFDNKNPHLFKGVYEDVKTKGVNMPYLFGFSVPSSAGGLRPIADLIDNMLVIRGGDMTSDGHPGNAAKLVAPIPGGPSLTGLVAERSRAPIPAIALGNGPASRAYRSPKGAGMIDVPADHPNYGEFLLQAFIREPANDFRQKQNLDAAVTEALSQLQDYARSNSQGADQLAGERHRAESMIRRGVADLSDAFPALVAKYTDLVERSRAMTIPGATLGEVSGPKFPFTVNGQRTLDEAVGPFTWQYNIIAEADILAPIREATFANDIAKQFALAEFTLTQGLSNSILISNRFDMGNFFDNVNVGLWQASQIRTEFNKSKNQTTFTTSGSYKSDPTPFPVDSHGFGVLPTLPINTIYYQTLITCLLELIDQLKAKHVDGRPLFDETVIHYSAEFDRIPSKTGNDTMHNFRAQVTSIYSGIIKSPMVLGNILVGSEKDGGTIGICAPVEALHGECLKIENISSTLSELTRVPRIVERARPVVKVDGDKVSADIEVATNVEGEYLRNDFR